MRHLRYALSFAALLLVLTGSAVFAFGRLGEAGSAGAAGDAATAALERPASPVMPSAADYAAFAAADSAWRSSEARYLSAAAWRARGDGRRTPRQAMQDRVYGHVRAGRRADAIRELERWTASHPADEGAHLWLARLLREAGRTDEALARYRRVIALEEAAR